ncbi:SDR family NAD(P)-dependent oxidoreductase [Leptospira ilyithenensis]|uniref:SDR family NAD(P)-dependent oxidoreductase n=1 Tax=Leptospira ilyithenensis TaxID=2484901 RepID=A0A4R9LVB8_9LEPT|nr:SDR family NAD(P)-dependent oxidoreductase [Leptospira ilyithenensis]TGN14628.1 SDR family NAD(P)-dependent oxidoreductase [Leptospira ilyithenensis]
MNKSKKIFIFGAGSGIGQAVFNEFNSDSANNQKIEVYGFSRRGQSLSNEFIPNTNHKFDLTSDADFDLWEATWQKEWKSWQSGKEETEFVVYFAQGDGIFSPVEDINLIEIQKHFSLNLFSSMRVLKIMSPALKSSLPATVVFFTSTAAKQGFPNSTVYCASKHAASGLAKALREEWKPFGTKVINAYFGAIATSIWDNRPEFSKEDMVSVKDAAIFLRDLAFLPKTVYLEEFYMTPKKGIL